MFDLMHKYIYTHNVSCKMSEKKIQFSRHSRDSTLQHSAARHEFLERWTQGKAGALQPLDDRVQPTNLVLGSVHEFVRAIQGDVDCQCGDGQVGGGDVAVAFHSVVVEQNDFESLREGGGRVAAPRNFQLLQPRLHKRAAAAYR